MLSLAANMIHACLYLHDLDSLHSFQQTGFSSLKLYIIYIEKLSECDCMCADHSLCLFYLLLNVVKCGQVFRAVRSIVNGFVAFFTACNRHRLRFVPPALSPLLSTFTDIHSIVATLLATNI
jgi:hypothetical protein